MSIITISRGSYSHGKEVAEKVAQRLGFACVDRDIILEASKDFNIPEYKLVRAIKDAPSIIDRIMCRKEKYITYIQAAVFKALRNDSAVYHGFAGHLFLRDISHVLKVRIIADLEDRVKLVMERDRISRKEALSFISRLDEERTKWSQYLYGINTWDADLYDLVINIKSFTIDNAVEIICHNVGLEQFQTTPESQQEMDDLCIAAEVKASVVDVRPDIDISVRNGYVRIKTNAPPFKDVEPIVEDMEKTVKMIPGVKEVKIDIIPPVTPIWNDPM